MNRILCNIRVVNQKLCIKNFHTCLTQHARAKNNPGISKRAEVFKNDADFIESLEDEEDIASLESDFSNADVAYHEHKRLIQRRKITADKMITKKKFFADPPQPSMLTWLERIQIKKLHSEDPETWNLDVLAESFPATREIISKVLKQKWQPDNVKKMKKMDARVKENWLLLSEGRLEADPAFLEHLKKFLPRREDHLAQLEASDVAGLLEPPKEKLVWNKGQMSGILESYERALDALEGKKERVVMIEAQDDRKVIDERIEFEKSLSEVEDDTVLIGKNQEKNQLTTLENLKDSLVKKETKGGKLNSFEKIMMEKSSAEKVSVTARLSNLAGYTQEKKSNKRNSHQPTIPKTLKSEKTQEVVSERDIGLHSPEISEKTTTEKIHNVVPKPGDGEISVKSQKISEKISMEDSSSTDTSQNAKSETDIEASSIQDTFFWPSPEQKKIQSADGNRKKPVYNYDYPQRIKIPKHQKRSGLTFQVNDCFYDDDGEFLYRVPGMTSANKS